MQCSVLVGGKTRSSSGKLVEFGLDAREQMLGGIERIAKAVSVTLGPKGRNVIIRQAGGDPKITKDGVTVARSIEFRNQFEDVGARLIRQVASKTNDVAGDGTTTATVLAWSIFAEGYKSVATGANPMDLKRGIDVAVGVIRRNLQQQKRTVASIEELRNVATISANGERFLGDMIADAVHTVGSDGFIEVLDGRAPRTEWHRHEGWSVERGFQSSRLLSHPAQLTTTLEKAAVFVASSEVSDLSSILPALQHAIAKDRALVIAAPALCGEAFDTVLANHEAGVVKACFVTAPHEELGDLADSVGATMVHSSKMTQGVFGFAERVEQTIDTTIVTGSHDPTPRVRLLQKKLERADAEEERDALRSRIAKLTHRFAVIRVGGQSAVEIMESKDRVIDALNAARAALAEGIVAGGGTALIYASKDLDTILARDDAEDMPQDQRTGILIVRNAARLPMRTIANNAGVEGPVVVEDVSEFNDASRGYDAQNDRYVDMFAVGIVDPVRVVDCCIADAGSVAGLMITTEAAVCDDDGTTVPTPSKLG